MKYFASIVLAAVLGSALTLIVVYEWNNKYSTQAPYTTSLTPSTVAYAGAVGTPQDFTATVEKVLPAVVHIKSTSDRNYSSRDRVPDAFRFFFDGPRSMTPHPPVQSSGSGVIINKSGYIVTNNHVVDGSDVVDVTLSDNRELKAEVLGTDPDTDLAVIKINEKDLPFISFVDSDEAKIGEWVLAIGNPYNLNSTVTAGIVSAKGRNINIINQNNQSNTAIESFIQTDAAINPGNSGGALVNLAGGLIGINTAIASPTGSYSGYGFAVPSNLVKKVVEDIIRYGTVQRGWLGIQIQDVTPSLVREFDLTVTKGAYVVDFADKSAAKESGIKKGDVIVKIDNLSISSNTVLIGYIGQQRPGDKVKVIVNRKGKEYTYDVLLKNKDGSTSPVTRPSDEENAYASLGVEFEEIDPSLLRQAGLQNGIRVKKLVPSGKLRKYTDIKEGFIVTELDGKPIKSIKEAQDLLKKKKPGDQLILAGQYKGFPREYLFALRL